MKCRECETCGSLFEVSDPRQRYCGLSCRFRKTWPPPQKPCEMCGKTMVKPTQGMSYSSWERRRFCSKRCLGIYYRNPAVTCPNCGTEFHPVKCRKAVYCSRSCYHKYRAKNATGPEWKRRPIRKRAATGQNFTPSQKKAIMARDGHRCCRCGATENLQVDHAVPVFLGGTNDLSNGQVLCAKHHWEKTNRERTENPSLVWHEPAARPLAR